MPPQKREAEAEVLRIQLHKAGGHIHLSAKKFNKWLREVYPDEGTSTPSRLEQWQKLVYINHFMWQHREIPREPGWTILVLIPKGNT